MSTRILRRPVDPSCQQQFPDLHPLLARIYSGRGVTRQQEISRQLKGLHSYHSLKDIDKAANVLAEAVTQHKTDSCCR